MPSYIYVRKTKWFRNIGAGTPGDYVQALYEGTDIANPNIKDRLAGGAEGGQPGTTYTVRLLTDGSKILAPCPDFCNGGETVKLNDADIKIIIDSSRKKD